MHIFLCFLLQLVFNRVNINTTKQKAVAPTKNEPPPIKRRYNDMRKFKITAANKKHFESLIKDFRSNGFMLVTYGARLAELETETEFVIIEF